jgi:hypothetical protein
MAMQVKDIEAIFPDPKGPNAIQPAPDTKVLIATMANKVKELDITMNYKLKIAELLQQADVNRATVLQLEAEAAKLHAQADSEPVYAQIGAINAAISVTKNHQEGILKAIDILSSLMKDSNKETSNGESNPPPIVPPDTGGMGGMEAAPSNDQVSGVPPDTSGLSQGGMG